MKAKVRHSLLETNRAALQQVFLSHGPVDERISLPEMCKALRNLLIFPDIVSKPILKQVLSKYVAAASVSFAEFLRVFKVLATKGFRIDASPSEKLRMLFRHSRNQFQNCYSVAVAVDQEPSLKPRARSEAVSRVCESERSRRTVSRKPLLRSHKFKPISRKPLLQSAAQAGLSPAASAARLPHTPQTRTVDRQSAKRVPSLEPRPPESGRRPGQLTPKPRQRTPSCDPLIARTFRRFEEQHKRLVAQAPGPQQLQVRVKRQEGYIRQLRGSLFGRQFVLGLLFRAWRGSVRCKLDD